MSRSIALILLLGLLSAWGPSQTPRADLVIVNAKVESMDPRYPGATAVAVSGDRILAVGSDAACRAKADAKTRVIDAGGKLLIPGFIESHGHFSGLGALRRIVDLAGTTSYEEVIERTRSAAAALGKGTWVVGRGWDQNLWPEKAFPEHARLSAAVPDHPVWLVRVDGHAALANAAALGFATIPTGDVQESGGEVIRDAAGVPTGVFIDKAMGYVSRHVPENDRSLLEGDLVAAQERCFAAGITSFHDAGTTRETVDLMGSLYAAARLKIRLYVMLGGSAARGLADRLPKPVMIGAHGNRLTVRALKLGVDGALGSRGAALLEDYADRSGHRGLYMIGKKDLVATGKTALELGYQVCVHAIGDGGNRLVVDAWDEVSKTHPAVREARFRVEHAQIVDAADIPRFAALGLIASMQGVHCTSDMPWVPERIGIERTLEGAYVWRKFLDAGVPLCNGTDAPVEALSALESFYATVTRQRRDGTPEGGWQPDQRLTRLEALHSYTLAGAHAAFEENIKGSLTPGKLADLTLLDTDILTCPPAAILKAGVALTVVGGEVVFTAP